MKSLQIRSNRNQRERKKREVKKEINITNESRLPFQLCKFWSMEMNVKEIQRMIELWIMKNLKRRA